jgi:hypothetical protein
VRGISGSGVDRPRLQHLQPRSGTIENLESREIERAGYTDQRCPIDGTGAGAVGNRDRLRRQQNIL